MTTHDKIAMKLVEELNELAAAIMQQKNKPCLLYTSPSPRD